MSAHPNFDINKQYEFVTHQQRHIDSLISEFVRLYLQIFVAVAGGLVWLDTQPLTTTQRFYYGSLADFVIVAVTVVVVPNIWQRLVAWFGFRKGESKISGFEDARFWRSWPEYLQVVLIVAVCAGLVYFNPLTTPREAVCAVVGHCGPTAPITRN